MRIHWFFLTSRRHPMGIFMDSHYFPLVTMKFKCGWRNKQQSSIPNCCKYLLRLWVRYFCFYQHVGLHMVLWCNICRKHIFVTCESTQNDRDQRHARYVTWKNLKPIARWNNGHTGVWWYQRFIVQPSRANPVTVSRWGWRSRPKAVANQLS